MEPDNPEPSFHQEFRDSVLEGKTPEDFLQQQIANLRQDAENPITPLDIADFVQSFLDYRVVTEADLERSLPGFGLSEEEVAVFMTETLPQSQRLEELRQQELARGATQKREQQLRLYCNEWGLNRLDAIAEYFGSHAPQLAIVNPNWESRVNDYQTRRTEVERITSNIENPAARAQILMRELYFLTRLHPSEAMQIFERERELKSYVYLDSLLEASAVMEKNDHGRDPGDTGVIDELPELSVKFLKRGDPEWNREAAINGLVFGARFPNEVYTPGKPLARFPKEEIIMMDTLPPKE